MKEIDIITEIRGFNRFYTSIFIWIWKTIYNRYMEKYLTQGVLDLVEKFDSEKDCIFILECDGHASGCIAITHAEENVAQLRYFFLEPEIRGLGAGTALLNKVLDFCREKNILMFSYGP